MTAGKTAKSMSKADMYKQLPDNSDRRLTAGIRQQISMISGANLYSYRQRERQLTAGTDRIMESQSDWRRNLLGK